MNKHKEMTALTPLPKVNSDWQRLARRSKTTHHLTRSLLIGFLILVSLPILLPYFWMFTISLSAKTGGVESFVLWRATFIFVPVVFAVSLSFLLLPRGKRRQLIIACIFIIAVILLLVFVGPHIHFQNYRFLWTTNILEDLPGRGAATGASNQFPSVWQAFFNSWLLAGAMTLLVVTVSTLAAYYLSRFSFRGRGSMLQGLLVLHAFPAMTMVIPIFLMMHWSGLIDSITGVMLVIVTLELPFSIFIMKGFFDAIPWDIEMAAIADGASRRQAFWQVILPQVSVGMIAVGVFAFIKAWEEYVFVRTLLFEKSNWMMSLYLFWVSEDIMGVDYGIVAAVAVFYILPGVLLYLFAQKYLVQMSFSGVKG